MFVPAGEHLVNASVGPGRDGKWRFELECVNCSVIGSETRPLTGAVETTSVTETAQATARPDSHLVLLRRRKGKIDDQGMFHTDRQPSDGLMIWIEEDK